MNLEQRLKIIVFFFLFLGMYLLFMPALMHLNNPDIGDIEVFIVSYPYIIIGMLCIFIGKIYQKMF